MTHIQLVLKPNGESSAKALVKRVDGPKLEGLFKQGKLKGYDVAAFFATRKNALDHAKHLILSRDLLLRDLATAQTAEPEPVIEEAPTDGIA